VVRAKTEQDAPMTMSVAIRVRVRVAMRALTVNMVIFI